jgi:hypothetical protein
MDGLFGCQKTSPWNDKFTSAYKAFVDGTLHLTPSSSWGWDRRTKRVEEEDLDRLYLPQKPGAMHASGIFVTPIWSDLYFLSWNEVKPQLGNCPERPNVRALADCESGSDTARVVKGDMHS